jgi:transposase-like protein
MAKKGQVFQKVPLETKLHIMKLYFEEGRSAHTLAREYEVSVKTIGTWIRIYKRDGGLEVQRKGRPKGYKQLDYKERYDILKKFTAYLKEIDARKK